jgi:hypothetical protein
MTSTDGGNGHPRTDETLGEAAELGREARNVVDAVGAFSGELGSSLREQLDRRPYVVLGAGFFGGYVLGGGLTLRVGALLLGAIGRAALASVIGRVEQDEPQQRRR